MQKILQLEREGKIIGGGLEYAKLTENSLQSKMTINIFGFCTYHVVIHLPQIGGHVHRCTLINNS